MSKFITTLLLSISSILAIAQNKMKPIEELINTTDPGWPQVQQWIGSASNKIEILPVDSIKSKEALYQTQVTTRSPMGAIIYHTGGLLVDHGWIRILASGSSRLNRSIPEWNKGKSFQEYGERPPFLLIADDAVGGFFAINGGQWGNDPGKVYYWAPDTLDWEPMDLSYTDFLHFCFNGNLDKFYKNLRWHNWQNETDTLDGNRVYNFFPMLWTKEGKNINKSSRSAVPVAEQYSFNLDLVHQLTNTGTKKEKQ